MYICTYREFGQGGDDKLTDPLDKTNHVIDRGTNYANIVDLSAKFDPLPYKPRGF